MFCLMSLLIMCLTFTAVLQLGQEEGKKKKIGGNAFPLKHGTSLPGDCLALAVIENLPLALSVCVCGCEWACKVHTCVCVQAMRHVCNVSFLCLSMCIC